MSQASSIPTAQTSVLAINSPTPPPRICIVTGLSGAGKSTALRVFEDLGYFTVDGLPASLTSEMVSMMQRPSMEHFKGIALGMDVRQGDVLKELHSALTTLTSLGSPAHVLFLEAQLPTLMRRYATTRRPHPLERSGVGLEAALMEEQERLQGLRSMADMVIDTTRLSIHDLRRVIQRRWTNDATAVHTLRVNILSFGFKYGIPAEADFLFDVRFLANPYFVEELREHTGKEKCIVDYVFAKAEALEFRQKLTELLLFSLPLIEEEGRYRITIAIGCTGGRHRSVATAEFLHTVLSQRGYMVALEHRHLELG